MGHQIKVAEVIDKEDGSAVLILEFDEDTKAFLMGLWGLTEWDESRAQSELTEAIRSALRNKDNSESPNLSTGEAE